jgi:hypothetical protein
LRGLLLIALVGCGDPISNALFYEDADFLAALPERDRLAAPQILLTSTVGNSAIHATGVEQAQGIVPLLDPLAITGEAFRTTSPSVRTDDFRSWDATPIVREDGAQWWARAEINRPAEGPFTWNIDYAPERDGPWTPTAVGQQEAPNTGVFQYTFFDEDVERVFQGRYGEDADGISSLELSLGLGPFVGDLYWGISGDGSITWTGLLDIGGEEDVASAAQVAQTLTGGRAEAFSLADNTLFLAECWDVTGRVVWSFDSVLGETGREASCALGPLFDSELAE